MNPLGVFAVSVTRVPAARKIPCVTSPATEAATLPPPTVLRSSRFWYVNVAASVSGLAAPLTKVWSRGPPWLQATNWARLFPPLVTWRLSAASCSSSPPGTTSSNRAQVCPFTWMVAPPPPARPRRAPRPPPPAPPPPAPPRAARRPAGPPPPPPPPAGGGGRARGGSDH